MANPVKAWKSWRRKREIRDWRCRCGILLEVIEFHRIVDIRYRDGKRYRVCGCDTLFEGHVWTPPAQHLAEAIRAAGQTRTEYRQLSNGVPLNVSALGSAPYARDRLLARHAWHTERGRTVTTESREVLTLTGEWEPVEVPATAAENGEQ